MSGTTMRDIAQRCDVSVQTVSRILRGHVDAHRDETVQRVLATARRLGYRPPWASVRSPATALPTVPDAVRPFLGAVLPAWGGMMPISRLQRIDEAAERAGYQLHVATAHDRRLDDEPFMVDAVSDFAAQGARAVILLRSRPVSRETRHALAAMPVPVIFVGWGPPRWRGRIVFNHQPAIEQLAEHLAGLGHRRVAFVARHETLDFLEHRLLPSQRIFARYGLSLAFDRRWLIPADRDLSDAAHRVVEHMLAQSHGVTAITTQDELAVQIMAALHDLGVRVPDEMSLVGFNDAPVSRAVRPALTTIRQVCTDLGGVVLNMVEAMLEQPTGPLEKVALPYELVVRDSTGPASEPIAARHHLDDPDDMHRPGQAGDAW